MLSLSGERSDRRGTLVARPPRSGIALPCAVLRCTQVAHCEGILGFTGDDDTLVTMGRSGDQFLGNGRFHDVRIYSRLRMDDENVRWLFMREGPFASCVGCGPRCAPTVVEATQPPT